MRVLLPVFTDDIKYRFYCSVRKECDDVKIRDPRCIPNPASNVFYQDSIFHGAVIILIKAF